MHIERFDDDKYLLRIDGRGYIVGERLLRDHEGLARFLGDRTDSLPLEIRSGPEAWARCLERLEPMGATDGNYSIH